MSHCQHCHMNIHESLAVCPLCGSPTGAGCGTPDYPRYRYVETPKRRQKRPLLVIMGLIGAALTVPAVANAGFQALLLLHSAAAIACLWPAAWNPARKIAVPEGAMVGSRDSYCKEAL